jgi:NitT/TauT family transport system permease protein
MTVPPIAAVEAALIERTAANVRSGEVRRITTIFVGRLALLGLFLGFWSFASDRLIGRHYVSDPFSVLQSLVGLFVTGRIWPHLWQTLIEISVGYVIGAGLAIVFALMVGLSSTVQRILRPFLLAFFAIPMIALAPLIIMWFGLGTTPKIILAAIFVFFMVFMNTVTGVESVNSDMVNVATVMGANQMEILWKIIIPSIMPYLMTGLRMAIPEAVVGAVIGEFFAATRGLGFLVASSSRQFNMDVAMAGVIVLVMLVALAEFLLSRVEQNVLRYRPVAARAKGGDI